MQKPSSCKRTFPNLHSRTYSKLTIRPTTCQLATQPSRASVGLAEGERDPTPWQLQAPAAMHLQGLGKHVWDLSPEVLDPVRVEHKLDEGEFINIETPCCGMEFNALASRMRTSQDSPWRR